MRDDYAPYLWEFLRSMKQISVTDYLKLVLSINSSDKSKVPAHQDSFTDALKSYCNAPVENDRYRPFITMVNSINETSHGNLLYENSPRVIRGSPAACSPDVVGIADPATTTGGDRNVIGGRDAALTRSFSWAEVCFFIEFKADNSIINTHEPSTTPRMLFYYSKSQSTDLNLRGQPPIQSIQSHLEHSLKHPVRPLRVGSDREPLLRVPKSQRSPRRQQTVANIPKIATTRFCNVLFML